MALHSPVMSFVKVKVGLLETQVEETSKPFLEYAPYCLWTNDSVCIQWAPYSSEDEQHSCGGLTEQWSVSLSLSLSYSTLCLEEVLLPLPLKCQHNWCAALPDLQ